MGLPTRYVRVIVASILLASFISVSAMATTLEDAKAHYTFEVIKHTLWPNDAELQSINIVVLGREPDLFDAINDRAQSSQIRNKQFSVQSLNSISNRVGQFEVIFITRSKRSSVVEVNSRYPNSLVITDGPIERDNQLVSIVGTRINLELQLNRDNLVARGFNVSDNLVVFAGSKEDFTSQLRDKGQDLLAMRSTMEEKERELAELNTVLEQNTAALQQAELQLKTREKQLLSAESRLQDLQQSIVNASTEIEQNRRSIEEQKRVVEEKQRELIVNQQVLDQQTENMQAMQDAIANNQQILDKQLNRIQQQESDIEAKDSTISKQQTQLTINKILLGIVVLMAGVFLYLNLLRKRANQRLKDLNSKLYEMATTDSMTLLFNRRHFLESTEKALKHQQRRDSNAVMLMLDIDHFKQVNDNYGHAMGDKAIIEVANAIKQSLRLYDIVGRLGGEEYGMMLLDCDIPAAEQIAERLRQCIETMSIECHGHSINVTISIGLSKIKPTDETINQVLSRADKSLYEAKEAGRNQIKVFNDNDKPALN
jgi:diguanylate cyclase (GGDEF)-like protein